MTSLPLNPLKQITDWLRNDWEIQISHIWRGGNMCVDSLDKGSLSQELGVQWLSTPHNTVRSWLNFDVMGDLHHTISYLVMAVQHSNAPKPK